MRIKILFIITGLNFGGAETMLLKLISAIDRTKFSMVVVSLIDKGAIGSSIEALGVQVYALGMSRSIPSPFDVFRLARIIANEQPQVIQGWMYHGNLAAQLAACFVQRKTPLVWNIRGTHTNLKIEPPLTALVIWLGARLSCFPIYVINNSRYSALAHQQQLGYRAEKWRIIPNGFDTEVFVPSENARKGLRSELRIASDTLLIGLVGRFHPVKDHAGFLQAASILLQKYPEVHFILVGEDVDKDNTEVTKWLRDERLQRAVHLLGSRNDLPGLTAAFDIATCSSISEGFPNVVGEAMSCGVPCVVTDVGDSAWIIGDTGRVVPPGNPEMLAEAFAALIELGGKKRQQLGTAARQRVIDNFSLVSVTRQYEDLYEEVQFQKKRES